MEVRDYLPRTCEQAELLKREDLANPYTEFFKHSKISLAREYSSTIISLTNKLLTILTVIGILLPWTLKLCRTPPALGDFTSVSFFFLFSFRTILFISA